MGVDVSFVLAYNNLLFTEPAAATTLALTATGTPTSVVGNVQNLRTPQLSNRVSWGGTGTGDRRCSVKDVPDTPAGRTVQLIALLGWKVEAEGLGDLRFLVEVQGSNTSYFDEPVLLPTLPAGMPQHWFLLLPEPVEDVSYLEVFIDGTSVDGPSAATSLTVSAGALWAGPVFTADSVEDSPLLDANWDLELLDPSDNVTSIGGQGYSGPRPKRRRLFGSCPPLRYALTFGGGGQDGMDLQGIHYAVGTTEPVVVLPRTTDSTGEQSVDVMARLGIYGRFGDLSRIRHRGGDWYEWSGWRVDELL
jgi:hypothetical protein